MDLIEPPPSELPRLVRLLDELTTLSADSAAEVVGSLGDIIPAPAWIKDAHGTYRYVNPAFRSMFASGLKDPIGKRDVDLWGKASAVIAYRDGDKQARFGPVLRVEPSPFTGGAGEVEWLVCKFPLFREGIVDAIAGFALPVGKSAHAQEIRALIEATMRG